MLYLHIAMAIRPLIVLIKVDYTMITSNRGKILFSFREQMI